MLEDPKNKYTKDKEKREERERINRIFYWCRNALKRTYKLELSNIESFGLKGITKKCLEDIKNNKLNDIKMLEIEILERFFVEYYGIYLDNWLNKYSKEEFTRYLQKIQQEKHRP